MAYLVSKGIDQGRLSAKGFGLTKPIATNDNDAGRQRNRRVEFKIVQQIAPSEKTDPPKPAVTPAPTPPPPEPTPPTPNP